MQCLDKSLYFCLKLKLVVRVGVTLANLDQSTSKRCSLGSGQVRAALASLPPAITTGHLC